MNFKTFLDKTRYLILDGAMGTELIRRGARFSTHLWSAEAIFTQPELIKTIHMDYIKAGADIITTNTFRTDPWTFAKAGLSYSTTKNYLTKAVQIAKLAILESKEEKPVFIAGSMSPLEDCYKPELALDFATSYKLHKITASWLKEAGVDLILVETMNNLTEAIAATLAATETGLPTATSFILREDGKILNGDDIKEAYRKLSELGINIFSINCTHHTIINKILYDILSISEIPVCLYVNAGYYTSGKWQDDPNFTPENFSRVAKKWFEAGVKIIGGCCFTSPAHIRAVSKARNALHSCKTR